MYLHGAWTYADTCHLGGLSVETVRVTPHGDTCLDVWPLQNGIVYFTVYTVRALFNATGYATGYDWKQFVFDSMHNRVGYGNPRFRDLIDIRYMEGVPRQGVICK